jgi:hypothetical protein
MTKINSGAGSPRPIGGPDSTEPLKETSTPSETAQTKPTQTDSSSTPSRQAAADKSATLKAVADGVKSYLDSELKNKGLSPEQKAIADKNKGLSPEQKAVADKDKGLSHEPTAVTDKDKRLSHEPTAVAHKDKGLSPEQKALADKAAKDQIHFAPPYVPVGPVVMGDNIATPGQPMAGEPRQMNLKADQFQINDQGNLVITNEKLVEYFKALKASGQEILLGITPKKPE